MVDENIKNQVKPFVPYRPFNNVEECWKEMQKHQPFGWLTDGKKYVQVFRISSNAFNTCCIDISNDELLLENINFIDAFNYYKFTDGSKFGVEDKDLEIKTVKTYTVYVSELVAPLSIVRTVKETLQLTLLESKHIVDDAWKGTGKIENLSKEAADKIASDINTYGGDAFVKEITNTTIVKKV